MKNFFYLVATDQIHGVWIALLKGVLLFLSWIYGAVVRFVAWLYQQGFLKSYRLSKPVISVGNITVGGVGKTPLVQYLALKLKSRGLRPVVLTRGYMDSAKGAGEGSDEAAMLRRALGDIPVLVGPDRLKNAREFLKSGQADVFLLDDGFQHWRIYRDMDIVVIDAINFFGNDCLMPRGILREPISALKRVDIFVLTKTDLDMEKSRKSLAQLREFDFGKPVIKSSHQPVAFINLRTKAVVALESIKEKEVCTFCSIGDPKAFEMTITKLGGNIKTSFPFIDHYIYNTTDIKKISQCCDEQGLKVVITTQKDAVKLDSFLDSFSKDITVLALKIEILITEGESDLNEMILSMGGKS